MKYSEFNNELYDLGMVTQHFESVIYAMYNGTSVGKVSKECRYAMSTSYDKFAKIPEMDAVRIFAAMAQLSETPLAEREEEKRYYLLSVSPMLRKSECGYLLHHKSMGRYFTGSAEYGGDVYQAIFTESEISQMDITGFEKIEVEEETK